VETVTVNQDIVTLYIGNISMQAFTFHARVRPEAIGIWVGKLEREVSFGQGYLPRN
jgi:hypothetical protein